MHFLRALVALVSLGWAFTAQAVIFNLVAPPEPVAFGAEVRLNLVVLNPAATESTVVLPVALAGRLTGELRTWDVELKAPAMGGPLSIAAGGFAVREYRVTLPTPARGLLMLEVDQPVPARVAIETRAGLAKTASVRAPLSNFVPPQTAEAAIQRTFVGRFSAHEPIYFIYGNETQAAKFQFSFKYRMLGEKARLSERLPALRALYFGYTQRSLWELNANSSPFYDTSYMPELMFESQSFIDPDSAGGAKWMGYQVGWKHESNGRDDLKSRSMNTVYFRPGLAFGRFDGWNLLLAPRISAYVSDLSNNPDIEDYRGNVELLAVLGRHDRFALALTGRLGRSGDKGGLQADLTIPVKFDRMFDFATYVLIQYWEGYGESLLDYNVHSTSVRAGFSLVR